MRMKPLPLIALLLALVLALPAIAGAIPEMAVGPELDFAADRIIVKYTADASENTKGNIRRYYGLIGKVKFSFGAELLDIDGRLPVEALVKMLNNLKHVEYAQPDYIIDRPAPKSALPPVTEPALSELWGMDNIDAIEAWTIDQGDPAVIVGVMDTGIDINHLDLDDNIWVNLAEFYGTTGVDDDGNGYVDDINGWNFCSNNGDVFENPDDWHGTHVAGTIAAEANGTGVVGVAPNCSILPLMVFDEFGFTSDHIYALDYAESMGARVVNGSWGGGSANTAFMDAIDNFDGVYVASAGNNNLKTDLFIHYPSGYEYNNIVSVAALAPNNKKASFSNYGVETVDLFAPGAKIWSTYPGDRYAQADGTSMAAPHVSGALALMISHEMHVNGLASDDGAMRSETALIVDLFDATVYSRFYERYVATSGRLNVLNALELTPGYGEPEPPPPSTDVLEVVASLPTDGAKNVSRDVLIEITFNQPISLLDIEGINLEAKDSSIVLNYTVLGVSAEEPNILKIQTVELPRLTHCTLSIQVDALESLDGDRMDTPYTLKFKTKNRL